ncbi:MAG: type II secretion system protein [Patescibacteria group bacterium]
MNKRSGFTLLELLIVIAIIGILASLAAVSYSSAQRRARDSQRQADLKAIQNALEQYYADNDGNYPSGGCETIGDATDSSGNRYLPGGLPTDPKTGDNYTCSGTVSDYCFCAELEATGTGNASNDSCNFASSGDYFCVTNLQ